jgi:hypothetical protein
MGGCIEIRHVGCCAYGVDFTRFPSAARWVYATSCTLMVPSASRRTLNGSAVVVIGVDRRAIGRDNGARWCLPMPEITKAVGSSSGGAIQDT